MTTLQDKRLYIRTAFFALFVLAPPLDILRYDLTLNHAILFGQHWSLGIDAFLLMVDDEATAQAYFRAQGI